MRANGNPTYFTADIAYHKNKFVDRHFDRVINVWGADHHGHVARLKGARDAIAWTGKQAGHRADAAGPPDEGREPYRMSKRTGKSITLSDLTDLVPIDAARFFFNLCASQTPPWTLTLTWRWRNPPRIRLLCTVRTRQKSARFSKT